LGVVCIGGLVTSKGVGMAVPDWPTTYGYNMFFFPISQWTGGIFHEHVHRLVASLLGLWTVILAVGLQWRETRPFVRRAGWVAALLVVFQGLLGGTRVVLNAVDVFGIPGSIFFGVLHATTAQVFLSLLVCLAMVTRSGWGMAVDPGVRPVARLGAVWAGLVALVLVQLVIAASMRHQHAGLAIPDFPLAYGQLYPGTDAGTLEAINQRRTGIVDDAPVTAFQIHLQMLHRMVAVVLVAGAVWLWTVVGKEGGAWRWRGRLWCGLFAIQFLLGAATVWSHKAADIATIHVAVGATILSTGSALVLARFAMEGQFLRAFGPCETRGGFTKTAASGRPVRVT
jgi:cytochrome c oxidase assembly protein subunit 15